MRLFLIDGSALAYRSHFAFSSKPLTNRRGMQTGAAYGFTTALLRLLEKEKPDLLAVVFDAPEKTFRHEKFPEYKATREKMPEEMQDQLPYIRRIVEGMRIPFLVSPGFEADDIIATLALNAARDGIDVFLVTGDKDFMQLLGPRVRMYRQKKGGQAEILDDRAPEKQWGVSAGRMVDLLALAGDSSDNVPGVKGIGEKTAARLVSAFGDLEALFDRLDEVTPPRIRELLRAQREQAFLSRDLVTLKTDLPLPQAPRELKPGPPDAGRLHPLFQELDFGSLAPLLAEKPGKRTDAARERYIRVADEEQLRQLAAALAGADGFALDTEATGLHPADARPVGLSFCVRPGEAWYVHLHDPTLPAPRVWAELRPILEDPRLPKGGQNVKYDRLVLKNAGVKLEGVAFDTMLESYLLQPDARQHGLDTLAREQLGIEKIRAAELIGRGKEQLSMLDVDPEKIAHYACEDADVTLRLHELFAPQIARYDLEKLYREVELPLTEVLGEMEHRGIAVDPGILDSLSGRIAKRLGKLTEKIHAEAGEAFNINSPKQLGPILFERLRIQERGGGKRVKRTKTGYATDQETLERYSAHPLVALLLEYRNLSKLLSTYVEALPALIHPETGRIHTSFNQTVAATGRLSSSEPNLQNIPIRTELGREIRKAFVPGEKGWRLLSADYSQIELRILAHLSGDETLIDTFEKGEDVHRRTASLVFGLAPEEVTNELRGRAKAINFGVIYGMGPQRLARETGISPAEAEEFIEAYFAKHERVRRYLDRQIGEAREKGFVTTILGRRRLLPDIRDPNPRISSNAERIAVNTPVQGSAADLIKVAMVRIYREINEKKLSARMLLQVHDELVFETPASEVAALTQLVREGMEGAIRLGVPIAVEIGVGDNWAEAH